MKILTDFLAGSTFFPVVVGLLFYFMGDALRRKFKFSLLNPLLISVAATIALLVFLEIDYGSYMEGAKYLSYLLTPATVALAVPLYRRIGELRRCPVAIIAGILSGTVMSLASVTILSIAFGLGDEEFVSLLPKSVTTAIGLGISEENGGIPALTAAVIMFTGVFGHIAGGAVLKVFRIKSPVAKGVAMGCAAHAIGTSRAMEMGEVEGAISSLSLVVTGIVTVVLAPVVIGVV